MGRKSTTGTPGKKTDAHSKPSKPKAAATTSASAVVAAPVATALKKLISKPPPKDFYATKIDLPPSVSDDDPDLVQIQKSSISAAAELNTATLSLKKFMKREMKVRHAAHDSVNLIKSALASSSLALGSVVSAQVASSSAIGVDSPQLVARSSRGHLCSRHGSVMPPSLTRQSRLLLRQARS